MCQKERKQNNVNCFHGCLFLIFIMKDDSDLTLGIAIAIAVLSSIYNEFKEVNFKQDFLSLTNIPLTHLNNIKYLLLIILIILNVISTSFVQ